jgi:branched-chain amino acid transport system substrate-binding protein
LRLLVVYIDDVNALGLDVAKGLYVTTVFSWDQDDEACAFAKRFFEKRHAMPSEDQTEVYVAVKHYVQTIDAAGTDDAVAVKKAIRALARDDGRVLYDLMLFRVKGPANTKGPRDYDQLLRTIPASEALRSTNPDACKF